MDGSPNNPIIVQSDRTIFLEVDHPKFDEARDRLMAFADLEKSPERIHIYRITPLSLWNAAASGISPPAIVEFLEAFGKYPVPSSVRREIQETIERFGLLRLERDGAGALRLTSRDPLALEEIRHLRHLRDYFVAPEATAEPAPGDGEGPPIIVRPEYRGQIKLALIKLGYPVEDLAGYRPGRKFPIALREASPDGRPFGLRNYQRDAVAAFHAGGGVAGGSGVVVLPCGAGKTVVGLGVMAVVGEETLILSTNITALRQWKRELLEKTALRPEDIGEYSGEAKEIRPVTLSTYQILTYRRSRGDGFVHFKLFSDHPWGLIVYDEVHLLPAPVFRFTAEIQTTRRLGLTATMVREDEKEDEVFSLIGPKKYDLPWRTLEGEGWIAGAGCVEIRVDLEGEDRSRYAVADNRLKFRVASENPRKVEVVKALVERHRGDLVLIIGQYLEQLRRIQRELGAPIITGKTPNREREELYAKFRRGEMPVLIVSKVGNFAVDLPDANVAIQVSGTFGSRQEEAQRLGRILRPKQGGGGAVFYSVVTRSTRDQVFAERRQRFLTEQGYHYDIRDADALPGGGDGSGGTEASAETSPRAGRRRGRRERGGALAAPAPRGRSRGSGIDGGGEG
jgi:DNA excision repair protein ERCC-3